MTTKLFNGGSLPWSSIPNQSIGTQQLDFLGNCQCKLKFWVVQKVPFSGAV